MPAPLHRGLYRLAHGVRRMLWTLRRPTVEGVRVLAFNAQGHLLMQRHSYGSDDWMFPGGGMDRGEHPLAASERELREETGCRLTGAREIQTVVEDLFGATNIVHVVIGRTDSTPVPDGREVIEAGFFPLDALPEPMTQDLRQGLQVWMETYRRASGQGTPTLK
ncbi:MutT/nudix family protein [Novosphingobium sp. KN65.2]|nr:MutT/nudix family protein [Novosphingobium sp. KN65.2]